MNAPLTPQDWEYLSIVLDGQLSPLEQRRAQDLLARRPEMRQALEELRRTRAVLRAATHRRAPRNFTLTPAMARQARPRAWFSLGWVPSLSFTSALATFLLVLTFLVRWPAAGLPAAPLAASAPMAVQSERMVQENTAASDGSAPPIILWNDNSRGSGPAANPPAGGGVAAQPFAKENPTGAAQDAAAMVPAATAAPKTALGAAPAPAAPAEAQANTTGPILGVAPDTERGQMQVPTREASFAAPAAQPAPAQPENVWPWLQGGLGLAALVSGLAALVLWRRTRR